MLSKSGSLGALNALDSDKSQKKSKGGSKRHSLAEGLLDTILNSEDTSAGETPTNCQSNSNTNHRAHEHRSTNQNLLTPDSGYSDTLTAGISTNNPNHNKPTVPVSTGSKKHVRSMSDFAMPGRDERTQRARSNSPISQSMPRDGGIVFQQPAKGQSLINFLSSQDFHTCAELDKVCVFICLFFLTSFAALSVCIH